MSELVLDNSKRSTFTTCKRKYYWQCVRSLVPRQGSTAIRYGGTWHACLEGFYRHIKEHGWEAIDDAMTAGAVLGRKRWDKYETEGQSFAHDYRTFENCMEAFVHYVTYYSGDARILEVIATEQSFECPLIPETPLEKALFGHLPPILFTGRIDLQVKLNLQNWLFETKTTGQTVGIQSMRLNRSAQLIGYNFAGSRILDFKPAGSLVSLHQLSARKSSKTGDYGKTTIEFLRVPQLFTDYDIEQWRLSFFDTCKAVHESTLSEQWPMCHDNCYQFGQCPYSPLCESGRDLERVITDNYIYLPWDVRENELE